MAMWRCVGDWNYITVLCMCEECLWKKKKKANLLITLSCDSCVQMIVLKNLLVVY